MKRLIAAITITIGLLLGFGASPAEAHTTSSSLQYSQCSYARPVNTVLYDWRGTHYGAADITQCQYASTVTGAVVCRQYVWGYVSDPHWEAYSPINGHCWAGSA